MQFLSIAAIALLSSPFALAAVKEARDEWQPSASSLACLYMTNSYDWSGESQNLCEVGGQCGNSLPDGLSKNVSSAGPPAGMTCFLYDGDNCTGTSSAPIVYPGYANLSDPVISFDKLARSWRCWKYCGFMGTSSSTSAITSAPISSASISTTNTLAAAAATSSSRRQGPSSSAETPSVTAIVLTHTFADASTELTTMVIAVPT
ncbi:hypothetical protein LTR36_003597 [Oleoguttula mirabilis]|uniref:Uncharacterized protein n=1 Tax=Oleoguttula mirabilis TaxID=1507867 RepID=A0AAV9JKI8_9PEZI|nr:hypothetical protein LTR36_003597 [Oleoguttula mirabilis]